MAMRIEDYALMATGIRRRFPQAFAHLASIASAVALTEAGSA